MAEENHSGEENDNDGRLARDTGSGVAVGTAMGTILFAVTDDPVWIALAIALGAGLGAAYHSLSDD